MRIRLGCALTFDLPAPTPMIALLTTHFSRSAFLEAPDRLVTSPAVPVESYRDGFGNWCSRLVAPPGRFMLGSDGVIRDDGLPDAMDPTAFEHAVEALPSETLTYLLGSRYCETDLLMNEAWARFAAVPPGWGRVRAIVDFVHGWIGFDYMQARATRTAAEAFAERRGVCRDYAHLAVTLCRCMNIPARYCTGYLSDIGETPPFGPPDFAAWMEVYLGGRWWIFDPRNNKRRMGRILIAQGRDAADVPLTHTFGPNVLADFKVWTDALPD